MLDSMPIAYAVTYMFGTVGSALVIALLGPCCSASICPPRARSTRRSRAAQGIWRRRFGMAPLGSAAFEIQPGGMVVGLRAAEAESLIPDARMFVLRVRRPDGTIEEATADTVLHEHDVVAVAGKREVLVKVLGGRAKVAVTAGGGDGNGNGSVPTARK